MSPSAEVSTMIKAAVLDMDGLMFDTETLVYEIWQDMMDRRGYDFSIEVYRHTVGKRKKEVELFYLDRYGADFPYWELADRCRSTYLDRIAEDGLRVMPGLFELLDFLKENRLKIALATSTSRRTSELNLKITGTAKYFDALVCGEDVKNGKPDPEVFLTAASRLGVAPECCAAFEDSVNGILSAYDAGMTTVMVPDYVQPTEELLPKISFLCGDLSESVECLRPLI